MGEITHADEIIRFTPESASSETQRLENILIAQGADDASRQEIVGVALEIQKALSGSNKTIRSVFNDVSKITSGAVTAIKNKTGVSGAYWKLFGENFKAIPTGSVTDNVELITEYTTAYTEALKNGNPEKYNAAIVSADGKDLSAELPQTIMQNVIPANVQNAGAYRLVATQIKNIISDVDVQLASERAEIYGAKAETVVPTTGTNSVKDAQTYNIIISNLKRKGEELGLLDRNFYVKLQEIKDFYNPTTSDKALISSEFQRVFAGNTDPLVTDWLKALEPIPSNVAEHNTTEPATEKSNLKTVTFISMKFL